MHFSENISEILISYFLVKCLFLVSKFLVIETALKLSCLKKKAKTTKMIK